MRDDAESLLTAAKEMPPELLPMLLGDIEVVRCTAMARLTAPAPAQVPGPDELLDVEEAARRLNVTVDHLYRHSADYSFTRRLANKVRFSALGLDDWIRRKGGLTERRQEVAPSVVKPLARRKSR
jgi:hypothetical protein